MATVELRAGRIVAACMLLEMVLGPVVNFALIAPLSAAPGLAANVVTLPMQAGLAVLLGLVLALLGVTVAIAAWPVLRRHSQGAALWLFAMSLACCAAMIVEHGSLLALIGLARGTSDVGALSPAILALRGAGHYLGLAFSCSAGLVFYAATLRFALLPRAIAGFGVLAAAAAIASALLPAFGERVALTWMMPLGIAQLATMLWLAIKGFNAKP